MSEQNISDRLKVDLVLMLEQQINKSLLDISKLNSNTMLMCQLRSLVEHMYANSNIQNISISSFYNSSLCSFWDNDLTVRHLAEILNKIGYKLIIEKSNFPPNNYN